MTPHEDAQLCLTCQICMQINTWAIHCDQKKTTISSGKPAPSHAGPRCTRPVQRVTCIAHSNLTRLTRTQSRMLFPQILLFPRAAVPQSSCFFYLPPIPSRPHARVPDMPWTCLANRVPLSSPQEAEVAMVARECAAFVSLPGPGALKAKNHACLWALRQRAALGRFRSAREAGSSDKGM